MNFFFQPFFTQIYSRDTIFIDFMKVFQTSPVCVCTFKHYSLSLKIRSPPLSIDRAVKFATSHVEYKLVLPPNLYPFKYFLIRKLEPDLYTSTS